MIRTTFVILLTCLLSINVYGQKQKYLTVELAGSGGLGSFNYETSFYQKGNLSLNYRIGLSVTPIDKNNGIVLIFPILLHGVYGKTKHKLDFGIGQTISITTKANAFILMPISFGYRLQPQEKNYYIRFAYTPIISYLLDFQWQHWAGITYGIKLNNRK